MFMPKIEKYHVIFIDNYDSFTHNLVDTFQKLGAKVSIFRNQVELGFILNLIEKIKIPKLLVLSPGPGRPEDAGCCIRLVQALKASLPILGVCLGHQIIGLAFGGTIAKDNAPIHGKATQVRCQSHPLFRSLPNLISVGRYHSLYVNRLPQTLSTIAIGDDKVMAMEHRAYPIYGLQFHPESVLTPTGEIILENLINNVVLRGAQC